MISGSEILFSCDICPSGFEEHHQSQDLWYAFSLMPGNVRIEKEGRIGWIIFDHPERRNAISVDMWRAIPGAAQALDDDPEIRVVVLRGAGNVAFVSGADISQFEAARSAETAKGYEEDNRRAFTALQAIRKPVLAMIHGFCVGGGVAIALTADVRYAADDAVFAVPPARLGLGYPPYSLEALVRIVGFADAKEILFTARRFHAEEARYKGLVNAIVPKQELECFVRETAEGIAANAPLTIRSIKQTTTELTKDPAARNDEAIAASVLTCLESDDYKEGIRAFLEKRTPNFKGK